MTTRAPPSGRSVGVGSDELVGIAVGDAVGGVVEVRTTAVGIKVAVGNAVGVGSGSVGAEVRSAGWVGAVVPGVSDRLPHDVIANSNTASKTVAFSHWIPAFAGMTGERRE